MRADAPVYVLTNDSKEILAIDPSLAHLWKNLKDRKQVSRSLPKRNDALRLLKDGKQVDIPLKKGEGNLTLTKIWLGELA